MSQKRVVLTRRMPAIAHETLSTAGHAVDAVDSDAPPERAALLDRLRGAAGVITMLSDKVDAEFLEAAGDQLGIVANYAVGFDNVDVKACALRGVRVTNTPGVLTDATADLTWALILATARRVGEGDRLVRTGQWTGWAPLQLLGLQLSGATLGVIGAGRIGTAVAFRSRGFDMRVIYSHPRPNPELDEFGATRVTLDELLEQSDVVTLHIPMRAENRQLVSAARLAQMKPGAILINTARGAVVDEAALVAALQTGQLAAAGLDVYAGEPALTPGLADLPNVVLLPHLGSATTATRGKMAQMAANNVIAVLAGREPPNPVN